MKELSLHILDLAENSIKANASIIKIVINENINNDKLTIIIEDNGVGMDGEFLKKVTNPFVTSRKTRNVGLGIPLMKEAALRCEGDFNISSIKGKGTRIECSFRHSNIDRAPLGNIPQTIVALINSRENVDIIYSHNINESDFIFDTREVKKVLKDVNINNSDVLLWIREYLEENINELNNQNKS